MTTVHKPGAGGAPPAVLAQDLVARLDRLPLSRWHIIFYTVVVLALLGDNTDQNLQGAINNSLVNEWHITLVQVGVIGSVSGIGATVGSVFFGWWSDIIGRRKPSSSPFSPSP